MTKNFLFALALLSLALASGCAKGGNGMVTQVAVTVSDGNQSALYPNQTITFTASVTPASTSQVVTWSLSGTACTGGGNPCGTINANTGAYQAPATPPSPSAVTVVATSQADPSATGTDTVNVVDITTDVAPSTLSVGSGLIQQFTAVGIPDDAPQTFTWTCTASNVTCAKFHQDPNVSGLAYYTANDTCSGSCIQISAAATADPNGCATNPKFCTIAKATLVTSRVNGTYAFRFSGYDGSGNATSVVGTFTASTSGGITTITGTEDEFTSSGPAQHSITGGSYTPTASDPNNSNNAGTLVLTTGTFPNTFQVVLDGAGDIEMIESDAHGTGSGVAQKSSNPNLFAGDQTYAFGFTGVDSTGARVGYVGVLPMNGSGAIVSGQMDVNDNGSTSNICGASPCSFTGTYTGPNASGVWHMTLTTSSSTLDFDFFIASGSANKTNPLTFYAISTDLGAPAVSGTMVLQDSSQTYNNAAFNGISVSALTGANGTNSNVALVLGSTDGNGGFSGQFDQNNAGSVLAAISFPPAGSSDAYAASGTNGRYTFQMLGNPTAKTVVPPLPFILYASGQNRGFLLDQSSSSVMTGTMSPQGKGSNFFGGSSLPGTYGAATVASGNPAVSPLAANLLLTSPGNAVFNVSGTQYPGPQTVTGTYTITSVGTGTVTLTAPAAQTYAIYAVDSSGCANLSPVCIIQDFFMMDETTTPNPDQNASIIFAKQ